MCRDSLQCPQQLARLAAMYPLLVDTLRRAGDSRRNMAMHVFAHRAGPFHCSCSRQSAFWACRPPILHAAKHREVALSSTSTVSSSRHSTALISQSAGTFPFPVDSAFCSLVSPLSAVTLELRRCMTQARTGIAILDLLAFQDCLAVFFLSLPLLPDY